MEFANSKSEEGDALLIGPGETRQAQDYLTEKCASGLHWGAVYHESTPEKRFCSQCRAELTPKTFALRKEYQQTEIQRRRAYYARLRAEAQRNP